MQMQNTKSDELLAPRGVHLNGLLVYFKIESTSINVQVSTANFTLVFHPAIVYEMVIWGQVTSVLRMKKGLSLGFGFQHGNTHISEKWIHVSCSYSGSTESVTGIPRMASYTRTKHITRRRLHTPRLKPRTVFTPPYSYLTSSSRRCGTTHHLKSLGIGGVHTIRVA